MKHMRRLGRRIIASVLVITLLATLCEMNLLAVPMETVQIQEQLQKNKKRNKVVKILRQMKTWNHKINQEFLVNL